MIDRVLNNEKSIESKPLQYSSLKNFRSLKQKRRMEGDLTAVPQAQVPQTFIINRWLYSWKLKHQILLLTIMIIISVTGLLIAINRLHYIIFASLISDGFTQILHEQNQNFQSSVMIKYISLTRTYFFNDQQMLLAINQIHNYALQSEYTIDKGVQCAVARKDEKYPSYTNIDTFCFSPFGLTDIVNYKNSKENIEFVKLSSLLSQFVLSFQFHLSYNINNYIQITFEDEEQMISVYPQIQGIMGYQPKKRPFYQFQKQQYEANEIKEFYVSKYLKWFGVVGGTLYGQTLTISLVNGTQFQGVIAVSIQFSVFDQIFQSFPDVNLALVASDGTFLYQKTQFEIYNQQQYIYNQSSTGYNYLDWVYLSQHQDYKKSLQINNTLFPEPINVNIGQFGDLPYYFVVYNNLTYENKIKTVQAEILNELTDKYRYQLFIFTIIVVTILGICYFPIELVMKPIKMIQKLIYCHDENFKTLNQLNIASRSNNMLYLLLLSIYLKYSELRNLSFQKSIQCEQMEDRQYPIEQYNKSKSGLILYLRSYGKRICYLYLEPGF